MTYFKFLITTLLGFMMVGAVHGPEQTISRSDMRPTIDASCLKHEPIACGGTPLAGQRPEEIGSHSVMPPTLPGRYLKDEPIGSSVTLAMHQGRPHGGRHERHQMHHGMGRGGQGICPQTRTTPQAPDEFLKMKNPLELTVENLTRGEDLYQWSAEPSACKVCHGATGNGLGMMAQGLAAVPRNFTCPQTMHAIPDGQLFWIIKNGSPAGMPASKFLSDNEIWRLIFYIRQFIPN